MMRELLEKCFGALVPIIGLLFALGSTFALVISPSRSTLAAFIFWLVLGIFGVRKWFNDRKTDRSFRWIMEGKCGNCGYDIRETPGVCPECGQDNSVVDQD